VHQKRVREHAIVVFRRVAPLVSIVLAVTAGLCSSIADGQQPTAAPPVDFTQWLQRKSYERLDYGKDGELKTHQLIQFGELIPHETGCDLPLRVTSFDGVDRSKIEKDSELSLLVECSNPHLVANILKFVGDSDSQHLEARVKGDELAYPEQPWNGMRLPDLRYTVKVKKGFLAVLGSKAIVSVSERAIRISQSRDSKEKTPGTYELHSEIEVKAYILGVRVRTTGFSSHLVVDPARGPIEETLEHEDGGRTAIRVVSSTLE
jgi:hypothetical protein